MKNSKLVYSTETGAYCPKCQFKKAKCRCASQPTSAEPSQVVKIERQTKGRKGKGVSLITGLSLEANAIKQLAKLLKQTLGCGGSVKQGVIEIQSDDRQKIQLLLAKQGIQAKIAGG